jgi:hypothetical protein
MKFYIAHNDLTGVDTQFATKEEAIQHILHHINVLWREGLHYASKPNFKLIQGEVIDTY